MGGFLDDCRLRFVQMWRRPPQNTPDFGGPTDFSKYYRKRTPTEIIPNRIHKIDIDIKIDELRSQTLQSHVLYTYLPSALKIAN